jgi:hypothetical protein
VQQPSEAMKRAEQRVQLALYNLANVAKEAGDAMAAEATLRESLAAEKNGGRQ